MNHYVTLAAVKARLGIEDSSEDTALLMEIERASRAIDLECHRRFFIETAIRYYDGPDSGEDELWVHDFLSLSEFAADTEGDGTYDGETWVANTDYWAMSFDPAAPYPYSRIVETGFGSKSFAKGARRYRATGSWGYADVADPFEATAITATVATTTGTTLTLSADGTVKVGHTIRVESEQMFVTALGTLSATVQRGVNGTTAAAHSAKAISTMTYPAMIAHVAEIVACRLWRDRDNLGDVRKEKVGLYEIEYATFVSAPVIGGLAQGDRHALEPYARMGRVAA